MKIGFIGGGNMATAMVTGILKDGVVAAKNICMSDCDVMKLEDFRKKGVAITSNNQLAVDFANYIFLAVKPQQYEAVIKALNKTDGKIFITMAPGISIDYVSKSLNGAKVIRTMPNTPALVGEGATAMCCGKNVSDDEQSFVIKLLSSFSKVYKFEESQMDDVVALSGSSPAYAYMFIEAIAMHSAMCGIDYETAVEIAAQTLLGSAKMVLETKKSPQVLRGNVCSKGGTTIKAVEKLEALQFADIIAQAMDACTKRAKELAGNN